ncbi:MAG: tetratricopeptide repeat protein [Gemmatimonadota bacterium]
MFQQLLHRRVPQLTGVYLAASWGIVEFTSFAVGQFALSPAITNLVFMLLLLLLPAVIVLVWRHGAPGADEWTKIDGAAVGLNVVVAAGLLYAVFGGEALGAATTIKLVEDMEGNTVERVVPKAEFRRNLLIYFFDNASGDPDLDWLETGAPVGVIIDLAQEVFVTAVPSTEPTVLERLRQAGFEVSDEIPLSLKREAAELRSLPFFMDGSIRADGEILEIETRLYDTQSARRLAVHNYRGTVPLELVDAISVDLRHDLGIPAWQIDEAVDLPAAELVTTSPDAYQAFVDAQNEFIDNDLPAARRRAEEAIALDSTFAMAYMTAGMAAVLSGDRTGGGELYAAATRHAYRLPERVRLSQQVVDQWLFQQNPEGAIRTGRYWTELYPQDADARRLLATLYAATGDHDETIAQSRALLAIDSADVQSMRQMAAAFRIRRDYDSALVYYERLSERLPSDLQTRLDVAATRHSLGQFDQARAELEQALTVGPDDPAPHSSLARLDIQEGHYEDAEDRVRRVAELARTPPERTASAGLEENLAYNLGQFGRLQEAYRRRLAAESEALPTLQVVGNIDNSEALRYAAEAGRERWALQQLDSLRSLVESPWNLGLEVAAVRIHFDLGDLESARMSLDRLRERGEAIGVSPGRESFIRWVEGRIAELEDGDCTRALDSYEQASELSPRETEYRATRLACFTSLERWDQAEPQVTYLLEQQPGYAKFRLLIARYHVARGQTDEAIDHLEAALGFWSEADANYIPAQEARALLAELQGA